MNIHRKLILFGILASGILISYSTVSLSQSYQPSLVSETTSGTPVRLILQDFASRPIANSLVTINGNTFKTSSDGVVNISSIPVGKVDISVEWKGSVYNWPPQSISAKETEQLITLRMPLLASYGFTYPRLIAIGIIFAGLIVFVLLVRLFKSKYKSYRDNKFHSASPYGHVSRHALKKAAKNNPDSLAFAPIDTNKPKSAAPTHQPIPATPIPINKAVKKESVKSVPTPVEPVVKQPVPEPIKAVPETVKTAPQSPAPSTEITNKAQSVPVPDTKPAPKPLNKVNGEVLPTGIEVHDLTE